MLNRLMHEADFSPLLPLWFLICLGILAFALCCYAIMRRTKGALFRLAGILLVLLWLSGPQKLHEHWRPLPQTALLVVDNSPSMHIRNREQLAQQAAHILTQAKTEGLTLRTVTLNSPPQDGTRLFDALEQAAADIPADQFAGAIMLTDGQVSDIPHTLPERFAATSQDGVTTHLPLHLLLTGKGEETDRRLRILQAPPYAIIGQPVSLRVQVDDSGPGTAPDTKADLKIQVNGEAPFTIPVLTGKPQDISIPVSHTGQLLVSLTASPLEGEASSLNNQTTVNMNGIRDRLRVLLISGTPNQGERVWRRLLKADPSVDLIHFTILRPPDKDDGTPISELALIAFPVKALFQDKIDQFDLIILDGFENMNILPYEYLDNIARFVKKGGGLLLTGGPEFTGNGSLQDTPVGSILPAHVSGITQQAFRPQLTDAGRKHPVTANLPGAPAPGVKTPAEKTIPGQWGPWYRALKADSTHGQVLLSGPDSSPLLVLNREENGRVAFLLSDQIWLWSRGEGGGGPQAELLRRISHWLMKEPELEEEQLHASLHDGTLSVVRRSAADKNAITVQVRAPDGKSSELKLRETGQTSGTTHGQMQAEQAGIWEVSDGTHKTFTAPAPLNTEEFADLRATADNMKAIVQKSGGHIFWTGDHPTEKTLPGLTLAHAPSDSLSFPHRNAHIVTERTATPLLPSWAILFVSLAFLFAGWWREGRP
ncbi:VWA domain-containing protein [Acetobacter thailandicus]|uniref:VWA domain-containing protein n=1 Tax=Acetobacter thailandicus TaxID=1502842 RepID=UPI001BAE0F60|nr:VWA domain-containing protein [Acetobacter thailandicus]MBS0979426.1 VWA domain-containing protein [Acetobacter thailandicus]